MNELHVGLLSGGKDSTAMAFELRRREPRDYLWVCTPAGNELPEMFDHWRWLGEQLGKPLLPVTADILLDGLIEKQQALPSFHARWCTKYLKIFPYRAWLRRQAERYDRVVSYVGLRADEEGRAGGVYDNIDGVESDFPFRRWGWGLAEVLQHNEQNNIRIPYRTDCYDCYGQQLGEWWLLWRDRPALYGKAEGKEASVTAFRGKPTTYRSPGRDTWPAGLADLRKEFEAGKVPRNTKRQHDLFTGGACRACSL